MKIFLAALALSVAATPALAVTFANTGPITVVDNGETTSSIVVSGVSGPISGLSLTLNGLSHTYPDDLVFGLLNTDLNLGIVFLSGVGGSTDISNVNLTFADGFSSLPEAFVGGPIVSGTYQSSNFSGYSFVSHDNTSTFSGFDGLAANGTWTLFVDDIFSADGGGISGGWSISFASASASPTPEPASWAMMIGGFGMIGATMRRRKTSVRFA
jgi:hypothetical protein